jgi:glycosyltransferase 2 family protein
MSRGVRVLATLVVTGLATAYLLWKVDVSETADVLAEVRPGYLLLTIAIMIVTVPPMAWRWRLLLAAKGMPERLAWLTRTYFTGYAAGQILPTGVGGDALRIYETSRRHPGRTGAIAASVLLERAIGGAATLALGGLGFALALGEYDVGAYLWLEGILVAATVVLGVVLFSRGARRPLRTLAPLLARVGLERPLRAVYEGIHSYRANAPLLTFAFAFTLIVQAVRILAIWTAAKAVGVDLSPRVYFVMGPLLFLVMLVPFTLNGFAVREAFFVSFLGQLGVDADAAFAAGFLFFVVTIVNAVPGGAILLWENVRTPAPEVRSG